MIIEAFKHRDIDWEKYIYEKFHRENEYPRFEYGYHAAFTVSNDDKIIVAAGVRPIAEVVMLTDLDSPIKQIIEAYYKVLEASIYTAAQFNYKELHAFTHPQSRWGGQLAKAGFRESSNKVHILRLEDGKKEAA